MRPSVVLAAVALAVAALLPLALDPAGYLIRVLTVTLLFAAMSQAWNIVGGLANQMSLGHAAFFGIGAYTSTILLVNYGLSPWIGMLAGAALGAAFAGLVSVPTMGLRGHYFALATLAFGEVMRVIANSWPSLTGGPAGISVPFAPDSLLMLQFKSTLPYYYLMLAALVLVTAVFAVTKASALGYRLRAVKENPDAAEVVGVDTARVKTIAAVMSGGIMAALGTAYAQFTFFFDPETVFGLGPISIRVALIAILGGIGTAAGPIVGAFVIIPLEELANSWLSAGTAGLSQLVYGVLLMLIILVQPRGLVAPVEALAARWRAGRAR